MTLVLLVLVAGAWMASSWMPGPRPNILVITVDTLRADRVGAYGFALARTPNMDALAAEGVRCADAIASAPITMPSHATLFTGLQPPAHGVRDNGAYALGDETVTLAERLKTAGYETQAFVSAVVLARRYGLAQGFDGYDDDLWAEDAPKLFMIRDRPASKTADRAAAWLERWVASDRRQPFFVWTHFYDPHQPYESTADEAYLAPSPYDAEIAAADEGIGRILEVLRERNLLDDTLVVLTSDHGESLGEHQEKTHALFIYDATVRVPLIWRYPARFPRGTVYEGAVRHVDIVPTILELLRLPGADETQGVDLLKAFWGKGPGPDLPQYSESLLSELGFGMAPLYGLREGGFKWIRAPKSELYDLRADPGELTNLYTSPTERSARLDDALQAILEDSAHRAKKATEAPASRETLETLQALGYLAAPSARKSMGGMDPKDGIAIYNRLEDGRHLAQARRWADAEQVLREILDQVPGHISARNVLGLTLLQQERLPEAREQYLRSLADDPTQFRVVAMLGSVAMLAGDLDEAKARYERVLAMSPTFVEAMANLSLVESLRGDDAEAERRAREAVAADPSYPTAHKRFGDLYFEQGEFERALASYEKTLAIAPQHFQALVQAGNSARRVGDTTKAAEYFERAATLRPDSWIPTYNLACLRAVSGDAPRALALLDDSVGRGLADAQLLSADADLASVRQLPSFAAILAKARHKPRRHPGPATP